MKVVKLSLLALTGILSSLVSHSQTADDIVNKYITAMGGKDKIAQVNSLYEETAISVMGNESAATVNILNGKGYRSETDFNGQKIVQVYTDKGGWVINPMAGAAQATAMPDEQYKGGKDIMEIGGPLYNYSAKGNKVELLGKENVGTVSAYKLKLTSKDSVESTIYIDPNTYLIMKVVRKANFQGQDIDVSNTYSDYKKTDIGMMVPYSVETNIGDQFSLTSTVKKVEVNKTIDLKIFEMPK